MQCTTGVKSGPATYQIVRLEARLTHQSSAVRIFSVRDTLTHEVPYPHNNAFYRC